jgi:methylthioribose-1-phosphate isomerase
MAGAVSNATTNVAAGMVGLVADPEAAVERFGVGTRPGATRPGATGARAALSGEAPAHRSPYRLDGDTLYLLDQRGLPDRVDEQVCRRGSDVAFYCRVMATRGGPLMAQLAAYGLALTAREFAGRTYHSLRAEWTRVCRSLTSARPGSHMIRFAVGWMTSWFDSFDADMPGDEVADRLRHEADRLAGEAQVDHAAIARTTAELLPRPEGRPLHLLIHGAPGTSTHGHVGTAINAIGLLVADEVRVKVWVTETRPYLEGLRLAGWELAPLRVETVYLPDSAVGSLLDREPIDAVLMGAETIAADGSTSNVVGSRAVAELAAIAAPGPVPVYITTPATTIDLSTPDGPSLRMEARPGRELTQNLATIRIDRLNALMPALDVIPPGRVTAFVTEEGSVRPEPAAIASAAEARAARRPELPAPAAPPPSPRAGGGSATAASGQAADTDESRAAGTGESRAAGTGESRAAGTEVPQADDEVVGEAG